jgi:predicted RNA polymerase sigma factor
MEKNTLIPRLFRTEYRKIVAVLCRLFGIQHIEIAEDIVSDTFLLASEVWGLKGIPENPTAWLYVAAKNKTKDYLKRNSLFNTQISKTISDQSPVFEEMEIDLSHKNINDSQLAMIFVVCHPCNPAEAQIGLALNLLCGFGANEISNAFLTQREVIYKRLQRAKEKLRATNVKIVQPSIAEIDNRLPNVLTTLYLLFNEGYYSTNEDITLRRELCLEAIRLVYLLVENEQTNTPAVNALLSLMCFHSSRFDARVDENNEIILYYDQDITLWNQELINKGEYFLNQAARGDQLSKFHLEAGIAYWHTMQTDTPEKWESILQLYNHLLLIAYSPVTALNRTYALAKANGKLAAIAAAEKINLENTHLYHSLLGELYDGINNNKAIEHLQTAMKLSKSKAEKSLISNKIHRLIK